ncbi:MAG: hypothetical protein IPL46_01800 [Saprospiraceae bacterium]|nr:hypothetical protein [Saprospiraceae bacterium]
MNSQTVENASVDNRDGSREMTFKSDDLAIKDFVKINKNKKILTFMGFSGSGYEREDFIVDTVTRLLEMYDPQQYIINAGATTDGIGLVYGLAKKLGFTTTGVVSTQANEYQAEISSDADQVYLIKDETWGGLIEGTDQLSPTSRVMVEVSDIIYALGGGGVTRDEYIKAQEAGKEVHFIPAEMNHAKAIEKAKKKNQEIPADFRGELEKWLSNVNTIK